MCSRAEVAPLHSLIKRKEFSFTSDLDLVYSIALVTPSRRILAEDGLERVSNNFSSPSHSWLHNRNWSPFLVPWPFHASSCLRTLTLSAGLLCLKLSPSFIIFYSEHPILTQVQHIWLYRLWTEQLQENSIHIWVYVTTILWTFVVSTW